MGFFRDFIDKYKNAQTPSRSLVTFKQALLEAVKDGRLSDTDIAELDRLKLSLGLAGEDIADAGVEAYKLAVAAAIGRYAVTQEDECELAKIQAYFGLADTDVRASKQDIADYRRFSRASSCHSFGEIPVDGIVLHEAEKACWDEYGQLMESSRRRRFGGRSSGVSMRVAKGFYYRVGDFEGGSEPDDELVPVSRGRLVITNQRVIFAGDAESFSLDLDKILSTELLSVPYGLQMSQVNGNATRIVHFLKETDLDDLNSVVLYLLVNEITGGRKIDTSDEGASPKERLQAACDEAGQHFKDGRFEESIACFSRALEMAPEDPDICSNLSAAYFELGKLDEAIGYAKKALTLDPQHDLANNNLGCIYFEQREFDQARQCYERFLTLNPDNAYVHWRLGNVYAKLGKNDEAISSFQEAIACSSRALEMAPEDPDIYCNLSAAYGELGKLDEAIGYAKKALTLDSQHEQAGSNLGDLYYEQEKLDQARQCYERVLALNPDNAYAHGRLGNVYAKLGKNDEAISSFKEAIRADPDNSDGYRRLGDVYAKLGEIDTAISHFRDAIRADPSDAFAHACLGNALQDECHTDTADRAMECYLEAVRLDPDNEYFRDCLADARRPRRNRWR